MSSISLSSDILVKNSNKDDFKYLSPEFDSNVLDLGNQKRFYPYEYISDCEKFKEKFPSKENFYSSLTARKTSDNEYEHAIKVWNSFETKTMKCYHNLYLKCDILLLADVFEKIRNNSLKTYVLYTSHYLSASVLIWNFMFNIKKLELEFISDADIYICSLKKVCMVEFVIFLRDIAKPIINI